MTTPEKYERLVAQARIDQTKAVIQTVDDAFKSQAARFKSPAGGEATIPADVYLDVAEIKRIADDYLKANGWPLTALTHNVVSMSGNVGLRLVPAGAPAPKPAPLARPPKRKWWHFGLGGK